MKKKRFAMAAVCAVMTIALAGCSMLRLQIERYYRKISGEFVHDHDL